MTTQNRIFLLSFISLVWAFVTYLILESDIVIYDQQQHQTSEEIEAVSGTMNFQEME